MQQVNSGLVQQQQKQHSVEEFQGLLFDCYNKGMLCQMISIGHRTGLFQNMMTSNEPKTSSQIAQLCNLSERYVREWLNCMVVSKVVDYDPNAKTYILPMEHAISLTSNQKSINLAPFHELVSELARVEDGIVECFKHGGGVNYDKFSRFQTIMAEISSQTYNEEIFIRTILPQLSTELVERLNSGINVVDVGCGAGNPTILMAKCFPNSKFTGVDFLEDSIQMANQHVQDLHLTNIEFLARDDVDYLTRNSEKFDLVTAFDSVHDQAQPKKLLNAINKALKKGGFFLMSDIGMSSFVEKNMDHPLAVGMYGVSCNHCMSVSLAQNGQGLGACWGKECALEYLKDAGLTPLCEPVTCPNDPINAIFLSRK
jgi:2-polyprenyl-3-methyl-5-hydroxy-6-metoxy-1,4-benzoquinol methylase